MATKNLISITFKPPLDKIQKKFNNIDISGFLKTQIKKLAFTIEGESKRVTPVDTGRLRASIFTKIRPLMAIIEPDTDYADFVHEGTSRMAARPFMVWGTEKSIKGFDDRMARDLDRIIQKEIK